MLSRLFIFFINYISRELDNTKILSWKLSVRYLVVKPACVNSTKVCVLLEYFFLCEETGHLERIVCQ